ncbi:MAG: hypothetical protein IKG80_02330 [Clostridia bacterium]|nr:hypothetical protein [Clostridia bacterium]
MADKFSISMWVCNDIRDFANDGYGSPIDEFGNVSGDDINPAGSGVVESVMHAAGFRMIRIVRK